MSFRPMARLASVLALAASAVMSPAGQPAALAASCSGSGCNWLDPQSTGCAGNVWQPPDGYRYIPAAEGIWVRYSTVCDSWWARYYSDVEYGGAQRTLWLDSQIYAAGVGWVTSGTRVKVVWVSPVYQWTSMLANRDTDRVRACLGDTCTAWIYG